MVLLSLYLISFFPLTVDVYYFDDGYAELWYEIPVAEVVPRSGDTQQETLLYQYTYHLSVNHVETDDSATIAGVKGAVLGPGFQHDYFIDHIPLHLYPGTFRYDLRISSETGVFVYRNDIHVQADIMSLRCSDLVLGRQDPSGAASFHGYSCNPVLKHSYVQHDTLFVFLELYGLIPDSLHYRVQYTMTDSTATPVFEEVHWRLKYEYTQVDTNSIALDAFPSGQYQMTVQVVDSSSKSMVASQQVFRLTEGIVSGEISVEQRLREADTLFATSNLRGRDTKRGHYYVEFGPPDETEKIVTPQSSLILEVWHYYGEGNDVLFSDIAGDDNPRLIAVLGHGELTTALEFGPQDPNWHVKWPWLELIMPLTRDYKTEDLKEDLIDAERN